MDAFPQREFSLMRCLRTDALQEMALQNNAPYALVDEILEVLAARGELNNAQIVSRIQDQGFTSEGQQLLEDLSYYDRLLERQLRLAQLIAEMNDFQELLVRYSQQLLAITNLLDVVQSEARHKDEFGNQVAEIKVLLWFMKINEFKMALIKSLSEEDPFTTNLRQNLEALEKQYITTFGEPSMQFSSESVMPNLVRSFAINQLLGDAFALLEEYQDSPLACYLIIRALRESL